MKKPLNFVLSIALLGNILCSTVALVETNPKVEKPIQKGSSIILYSSTDPETVPE